MNASTIRTRLKERPFRPVELVLDNGERVVLPSPEVIVAEDFVATTDERGELVLISTRAVSMVRKAGDGKGKGAQGE